MYTLPPGPPHFQGPFPQNYGVPQRPYLAPFPDLGVNPGLPVGPPPFMGPWPPMPMGDPPFGRIPGGVPPLTPQPFQDSMPSPRYHSRRRHSMHVLPESRPCLSRKYTFLETNHYKTDGEGQHQKKVRECHGQVSSTKTREKEQVERFKEKRRRCRDSNGPSARNVSQKKPRERSRDESTKVEITIGPEGNNEPRDGHKAALGEERPRRTTTRKTLSLPGNPPSMMPPRVPELAASTYARRSEMPSSRLPSVERVSPVDSPPSSAEAESKALLREIIDILMGYTRDGGTAPPGVRYRHRSRKKYPVSKLPRKHRLCGTSALRESGVWIDKDGEGDVARGKRPSSKQNLRRQYASRGMEQHLQDARRHQWNTRLTATSKSPKGQLPPMLGQARQREGEADLGLILRGLLAQISRATRTNEVSILDDDYSWKYIVAIIPARPVLSQRAQQYLPYHIPGLLALPID